MAKSVIQYWLDKQNSYCNSITDVSFDNLTFLSSREPLLNESGERVSKSYYDKNGREAIRINYSKIIGDYVYDGVTYENVFQGLKKSISHFDLLGQELVKIDLAGYYFTLSPVYKDGDIIGFSSLKQKRVLAVEQYYAGIIATNN